MSKQAEKKKDQEEEEEQATSDHEEEKKFNSVDKLQDLGIGAADIKKLKENGIHTVEARLWILSWVVVLKP